MFLMSVFGRPRTGHDRAVAVYPVPSFVFYRTAAVASGLEPLEVDLADGFALDEDALQAAIDEHRPNLAFFARPNNPTGTLWSRSILERTARDNPDLLVIVDEAYIDYGGDSMIDLVGEVPNLAILRTLSKLGLAALRVGFLCADVAVAHELEKVRPPYNVSALSQRAASWLLQNHATLLRDRCKAVVAERERVACALAGISEVCVFESHANLLLVRVGEPGDGRAAQVWEDLAGRGVLVRRFAGVDSLRGCLRITIGSAEENQRLLDCFPEVLA